MAHGVASPGALTPRAFRLLVKAAGRRDRERDLAELNSRRFAVADEDSFRRYANALKREPKDD